MFLPGCFGVLFLRHKGGKHCYDDVPPLYSENSDNNAGDVLATIEATLDACSPALRRLSLSIHGVYTYPLLCLCPQLILLRAPRANVP